MDGHMENDWRHCDIANRSQKGLIRSQAFVGKEWLELLKKSVLN